MRNKRGVASLAALIAFLIAAAFGAIVTQGLNEGDYGKVPPYQEQPGR